MEKVDNVGSIARAQQLDRWRGGKEGLELGEVHGWSSFISMDDRRLKHEDCRMVSRDPLT